MQQIGPETSLWDNLGSLSLSDAGASALPERDEQEEEKMGQYEADARVAKNVLEDQVIDPVCEAEHVVHQLDDHWLLEDLNFVPCARFEWLFNSDEHHRCDTTYS